SSPEDSDYSVQDSDSDLTLSDSSANAELSKELDRLIQPDDFVIVKMTVMLDCFARKPSADDVIKKLMPVVQTSKLNFVFSLLFFCFWVSVTIY
ncbi:hypothetical protein L9F63_005838, partial [Diploptera punctata]